MIGTPASSGTTSALDGAEGGERRVGWSASIVGVDVEERRSSTATIAASSRSINIVRDAFDGFGREDAAVRPRRVSHQSSQVSTVARLGCVRDVECVRDRGANASCVAEKYESSTSPVVARTCGVSCPRARVRRRTRPVRRSCQTRARWARRPFARSKATVVSRWFVMPSATMTWRVRVRAGGDLAQRRDGEVGDLGGVVLDLARVGEVLGELAIGDCRRRRAWTSKATARTPDVPASRARTSSTGVRLPSLPREFSARSLG